MRKGNKLYIKYLIIVLTCSLLTGGCIAGDTNRNKLERGMAYAKSSFSQINSNLMAALSYQSIIDVGGGLLTYLTANMPEKSDLPKFLENQSPQPWSIVVSIDGSGEEITIEGYSENLSKPELTEKVLIDLSKWNNEIE